MAQKTFVDNDVLTASDINTYLSHEGGSWTSHTPQIDQGASTNISKTVNYSRYARAGRVITWNFRLTLTASGSAGSGFTLTLPVEAVSANAVAGSGAIFDTSTSTRYAGVLAAPIATNVSLVTDATGSATWGNTPSIALASGDVIQGSITYEALA